MYQGNCAMENKFCEENDNENDLYLTVDIITSYISRNNLSCEELTKLINLVFSALKNIKSNNNQLKLSSKEPFVPIKKSIYPDYLVCLEDGKKLIMLKRYLKTNYNMTPEDYRSKWNLPADYPMVAPNYAQKRSQLAKNSGLGKLTGRKRH